MGLGETMYQVKPCQILAVQFGIWGDTLDVNNNDFPVLLIIPCGVKLTNTCSVGD